VFKIVHYIYAMTKSTDKPVGCVCIWTETMGNVGTHVQWNYAYALTVIQYGWHCTYTLPVLRITMYAMKKVIICSCHYIMLFKKLLTTWNMLFCLLLLTTRIVNFEKPLLSQNHWTQGNERHQGVHCSIQHLFMEKCMSHENSLQNSNAMMGCTLQHWTFDVCSMTMYSMQWLILNRPRWCVVLL